MNKICNYSWTGHTIYFCWCFNLLTMQILPIYELCGIIHHVWVCLSETNCLTCQLSKQFFFNEKKREAKWIQWKNLNKFKNDYDYVTVCGIFDRLVVVHWSLLFLIIFYLFLKLFFSLNFKLWRRKKYE